MDIYKERSELREKLKLFLFGDAKDFIDYMPVISNKYGEKEYKKSLKLLKKAFNSGDEDIKIALWNEMYIEDYDEKDFTKEENDFIKERIECRKKSDSYFIEENSDYKNINDIFTSERLMFVPSDYKQYEAIEAHKDRYRNDEEFKLNTSGSHTIEENIDTEIYYFFASLKFIIYKKETNKPIGNIGIESFSSDLKKGNVEYYIFKEYRDKGYEEEAIKAFVEVAFSNKLKRYEETIKDDVYIISNKEIELVYKEVRTDDIYTQKILESCGFEKVGTKHRTNIVEGKYYDSYLYELMKG